MKNSTDTFSWKKIRFFCLLLVPVTLFLPININSIIIILTILLFSKKIYEHRKEGKRYKKHFLFSYLFVVSVLIAVLIDLYYGIFYPNFLERIIPFVVLPLVFFLGVPKDFKAFKLIKWFSYSITVMNLILILFAGITFLKNSNTNIFIDDSWIKTGLEVVENSTIEAPNGKQTGIKVIETAGRSSHDLIKNDYQGNFSEKKYFRSIFLKYAEREWVLIRQYDGITHKGVWFNIKEGFIGKKENGLDALIEDYGNGWFKCSVLNTTAEKASKERIQLSIVNGNESYRHQGDGKSGLYVWGAQIGEQSEMTQALPSDINLNFRSFSRTDLLSVLAVHPSYYALFLLVAIVYFVLELFTKVRWSTVGILIFNVLIVLLISSKGAIVSLIGLLVILSILTLVKRQKIAFPLMLFTGGIILACATIPFLNQRITQSVETVLYDKHENLSTSKRLMVWKAISEFETKQLVFGLGKKNGRMLLNDKVKADLNAHNQYLEALLMSGAIGLVCVVLYLLSPLFFMGGLGDRERIFIIGLVTLVMCSALFESILNRQWGIVFVSFFYALAIREKIIKSI
ncbi:O-antigen ligase family protein [Spongiimicrobium salis]|uniref:O-antigen ligase family protein n=1 Tax=Spongiimicrobium salis TaxID=1667022 RepID=UPI00374CAE81